MALTGWGLFAVFLAVAAAFSALLLAWAVPGARWVFRSPLVAFRTLGVRLRADAWFVTLALGMVVVHGFEVNFVEPRIRPWWLEVTGFDFAGLLIAIEDGLALSMSALQEPHLTWAVLWFYLVLHNTMVFVAPLLLFATGERALLRALLLTYPVIYVLALPGFLLFPAENPYVHYGLPSPLERFIPGSEELFYRGTSIDNTIPSLHVGLSAMISLHLLRSGQPRLRLLAALYAPAVAVSVVFLQVHYALDVVAGAAVAVAAVAIARAIGRRWPAPSHKAKLAATAVTREARKRQAPFE